MVGILIGILFYANKKFIQAGAELCQAQFKLGLAFHALIGCKVVEI